MTMHNIFIDIETIPNQSQEYRDKVRAGITAPGSYKKPESIAQWMAENAEAEADAIVAKTSFDPAAGHICSIAWAVGDGEVQCASIGRSLDNEASVIDEFFDALPKMGMCRFIGHYITGFDLRFIMCRAIILGVRVPALWPRDPKPWDQAVFDTMTAWAGARGTISLDRLCEALGIDSPKGEIDGSQVGQAWADGRFDEIAAYNRRDVVAVREVYRKFEAVGLV
jgi:3'-5' exonuclease